MSELKPCDHCGILHNSYERCWEAMRHRLAETQETLSAMTAERDAALAAVKRRDEVIEELCVKLNRHTCPASEAWDVCRNKNVECKDCWRDWIKSKLEKVKS